MIPKVIHFCWLSGEPYPALIEQCINSWKQFLPDYELILWDTSRIDINSNQWLKQAYENKKYAFAADYIRFYALYYYGGIYLDADVEVFKSFTPLLNQKQFIGEEAGGDIEAAVRGAEKGLWWVKECLDYYHDRAFVKMDGTFDTRPVPILVSKVIAKTDIKILPFYYFSPKDFNVGKICITKSTYCIHRFDGKWLQKKFTYKFKRTVHRIIYLFWGRIGHNRIVRIIRKIK